MKRDSLPLGKRVATRQLNPILDSGSVWRPHIPLTLRDRLQRAWLGRNTANLAELFTASDNVNRIRGVAERGAESPFAAALARMFLQTGAGTAPR